MVRRPQKTVRLWRLEWLHLKQKQKTVAMRAIFQMKNPKLVKEIIQPLREREVDLDRAAQTLERHGYQKGTVSPVC